MIVIALESSAKAASCAVMKDGVIIGQNYQNSGLTHSRTLLPMAEDLLKNLDLKLSDVDYIAVAKGPGSFTGIRIGVAAAKGLAWGADKPVCGVSTLLAMAQRIVRDDVVICPVMDARRSQVYNALFDVSCGKPVRLTEDRAISVAELMKDEKNSEKPFFLVGDGAEMCYNIMSEAGCNVILAPAFMRFQSADGVAMASSFEDAASPDILEPSYLRLSQAERERLEKLSRDK